MFRNSRSLTDFLAPAGFLAILLVCTEWHEGSVVDRMVVNGGDGSSIEIGECEFGDSSGEFFGIIVRDSNDAVRLAMGLERQEGETPGDAVVTLTSTTGEIIGTFRSDGEHVDLAIGSASESGVVVYLASQGREGGLMISRGKGRGAGVLASIGASGNSGVLTLRDSEGNKRVIESTKEN